MYAQRPKITEATTRICMHVGCEVHSAEGFSMRIVPIGCSKPQTPCSGYLAQIQNPCGFRVITLPEPVSATFELMEATEDGKLCSLVDRRTIRSLESGIYLAELLKDGKPVPGACFEVEVQHVSAKPTGISVEEQPVCIEDCVVDCDPPSSGSAVQPEDRPLWSLE